MTSRDPQPSFSIVLPTFNRCAVVRRTLAHLLDVDWPADRFEILVADNSTDATPRMVREVARRARAPVRLLVSAERLPAVKRNQALRAATGELVLFMNDDVWVRPDFLAEHARTHAAHREPIAVLGHVEQSLEMSPTAFNRWYRPFDYDGIADAAGREVSWRYFWSINLSLPRRETLGRGLRFHEDWSEIGHEDVELGYRWTRAGRRIVYNPGAWGEHFHPHTLASACRLQASIGRGLRDLERLVPEPELLESYGVFAWRNSPRAVARGLARRALFNPVTVPLAERWLEQAGAGPVSRWMYWKVLLHHTNAGYRAAAPRRPQRLVTGPPVAAGVAPDAWGAP